jgi:hypothetical protein
MISNFSRDDGLHISHCLSMSFMVAFHEIYSFRVVLKQWCCPKNLTKHVWFYHEFTTNTSQDTLFWGVVKCLGELLMSPNFQSTPAKILKKWGFVQTTFSLPPSIALAFHEVLFQGCRKAMKLLQKNLMNHVWFHREFTTSTSLDTLSRLLWSVRVNSCCHQIFNPRQNYQATVVCTNHVLSFYEFHGSISRGVLFQGCWSNEVPPKKSYKPCFIVNSLQELRTILFLGCCEVFGWTLDVTKLSI